MGAWRIVIPSRGGVRTPHTWSPGLLWPLCSEPWTVTSVLRCDVAAASGFGGGCRERGSLSLRFWIKEMDTGLICRKLPRRGRI